MGWGEAHEELVKRVEKLEADVLILLREPMLLAEAPGIPKAKPKKAASKVKHGKRR